MKITFSIIILTVITSIIAFPMQVQSIASIRKPEWFNKYKFNAYAITKYKQIYRLFSYGFIHANWWHLAFNMITLYFFGGVVEKFFAALFPNFGGIMFIVFYISAIAISSIHDLIAHKNHEYYSAVGASGAVSAVLFAAILFYPNMKLFIFLIPIPITAWIFGIIYLAYSFFMSRKNIDNIGHTAHFWGSVYGFIFPIIFNPAFFALFLKKIF